MTSVQHRLDAPPRRPTARPSRSSRRRWAPARSRRRTGRPWRRGRPDPRRARPPGPPPSCGACRPRAAGASSRSRRSWPGGPARWCRAARRRPGPVTVGSRPRAGLGASSARPTASARPATNGRRTQDVCMGYPRGWSSPGSRPATSPLLAGTSRLERRRRPVPGAGGRRSPRSGGISRRRGPRGRRGATATAARRSGLRPLWTQAASNAAVSFGSRCGEGAARACRRPRRWPPGWRPGSAASEAGQHRADAGGRALRAGRRSAQ